MNQPEQDDPVWKLLEHSKQTTPGPYFSRRVMRQVRELNEVPSRRWLSNLFDAFSPGIAIPSFAAVAALAFIFVFQINKPSTSTTAISPELVLQIGDGNVDPAAEMEAVEYLGQLMAVADPGQLSDDALADLFF